MAKYTVKDSNIIKVVASTKLKIGSLILTLLPNKDGIEYTTTVVDIREKPGSANYYQIRVPLAIYNGWFDVGYIKEML